MAGRPRKDTEKLEDAFFDCDMDQMDALLEKFAMLRRLKARQAPEKRKPEPSAEPAGEKAATVA